MYFLFVINLTTQKKCRKGSRFKLCRTFHWHICDVLWLYSFHRFQGSTLISSMLLWRPWPFLKYWKGSNSVQTLKGGNSHTLMISLPCQRALKGRNSSWTFKGENKCHGRMRKQVVDALPLVNLLRTSHANAVLEFDMCSHYLCWAFKAAVLQNILENH